MSRTQRGRTARERFVTPPPKAPKPLKPEPAPAKPWYPKMTRQALIVRLVISAACIAYITKLIIDGFAAQHR
jgi:hypothetical protein